MCIYFDKRVLVRGYKICFNREMWRIIPELSILSGALFS